MQKRIIEPGPLHDEQGKLIETGYATELIRTYDRSRVAAKGTRIKEWDYYAVCTDRFALALTIDHNGYMTMDSVSLLDFEKNTQMTKSIIGLPFTKKRNLPATSAKGDICVKGKEYMLSFENDGHDRHLSGFMNAFSSGKTISFDLYLTDAPKESMVIVTPFRDHPGVWTYDNTWYWGSASGAVDGVPFGFNIGYGFGDTSAASENVLFYDGKIHKLSQVRFEIPQKDGKDNFMARWRFTSDDGRFMMKFEPIVDRSSKTNLGIICSDQHQVFGRFTGTAVLDDGKKIQISRLIGFAEKVRNKW